MPHPYTGDKLAVFSIVTEHRSNFCMYCSPILSRGIDTPAGPMRRFVITAAIDMKSFSVTGVDDDFNVCVPVFHENIDLFVFLGWRCFDQIFNAKSFLLLRCSRWAWRYKNCNPTRRSNRLPPREPSPGNDTRRTCRLHGNIGSLTPPFFVYLSFSQRVSSTMRNTSSRFSPRLAC